MSKPRIKPGDVVEIIWEDAWGSTKWGDRNGKFSAMPIAQIGYLIKWDKECLVLAGGYSIEEPDQVNAVHYCPIAMVKKVRKLS